MQTKVSILDGAMVGFGMKTSMDNEKTGRIWLFIPPGHKFRTNRQAAQLSFISEDGTTFYFMKN